MPIYKVKIREFKHGSITVIDRQYPVEDGICTVDNLNAVNFLIEHGYGQVQGIEGIRSAGRILVRRGRGLGDVLMMTPVLRKIRQMNPGAYLTFACDELFIHVLEHLNYINSIVPMSWVRIAPNQDGCFVEAPSGRVDYDLWINCENVAETAMELNSKHRVDIFAESAGLQPLSFEDKRLDYVVTREESQWADAKFKEWGIRPGDKVLGMAVRSTAANRNMPGHKFRQIADMAAQAGWRVILFDHDAAWGWEANSVVNMAGRTNHREMGALLAKCSMAFGPDSGLWHLACALGIPNVVYFGAIDYKLRVTSQKTRVIFKNVPCYPCNSYGCHANPQHICVEFEPAMIWDVISEHAKKSFAAGTTATPAEIKTPEPSDKIVDIGKTDIPLGPPPGVKETTLVH